MNYPYYPGLQQPAFGQAQQQQQIGIKGRPVSSIDEVRATSIDFDGSIFYFPDLANKRIYTKQINIDGTSTLNIYELKPIPVEAPVQYVTRQEFETVLSQLQQKIAGAQPISAPQVAPVEEPQPAQRVEPSVPQSNYKF